MDSAPSRTSKLYSKYGPIIFSRCRQLLKDERLAETATVEVFIRVAPRLAPTGGELEAIRLIGAVSMEVWPRVLRDEVPVAGARRSAFRDATGAQSL